MATKIKSKDNIQISNKVETNRHHWVPKIEKILGQNKIIRLKKVIKSHN